MLPPCIPKQLRRPRRLSHAPGLLQHHISSSRRVRPILEEALQATGKHLLKPNHQHAVRGTMGNHVAPHVQSRGARGAVIVDVVDGDARHAELVEDALAARAVAVAVACHALVHVVVVDVCVQQRFDACFEAQLRVVDFAAGLDELRLCKSRMGFELLGEWTFVMPTPST
jgi:hypothetical protein